MTEKMVMNFVEITITPPGRCWDTWREVYAPIDGQPSSCGRMGTTARHADLGFVDPAALRLSTDDQPRLQSGSRGPAGTRVCAGAGICARPARTRVRSGPGGTARVRLAHGQPRAVPC